MAGYVDANVYAHSKGLALIRNKYKKYLIQPLIGKNVQFNLIKLKKSVLERIH